MAIPAKVVPVIAIGHVDRGRPGAGNLPPLGRHERLIGPLLRWGWAIEVERTESLSDVTRVELPATPRGRAKGCAAVNEFAPGLETRATATPERDRHAQRYAGALRTERAGNQAVLAGGERSA